MNNKIFELILTIIPVLGTFVTAYLIPLLKEKISTEKLSKYKSWAVLAVKCAEMIYSEANQGTDKKSYVADFLNKIFNKKKEVLTEEQINVLIEATVQEMNNNQGSDTFE